MPALALEFMLPGDPLAATGGYEYDRRMVEGLRTLGWTVRVHLLDGSFPIPTQHALDDAHRQLAALPSDSLVLIDGLALGAMPEVARAHADRLWLIALVHHPLAAETGLSQQLAAKLKESERRALQTVRQVIVTSRATRIALADYGVEAERIAVVEPGNEIAVFPKPEPGCVENVALQSCSPAGAVDPRAPLRMLCVATLTPRKGHDLLVDALSQLREHSWTLTCVGDTERDPATASSLRAQIAAARLEDRITLAGQLDAELLDRQFRAADLFVLATRFEGYGMAVAQALTYGLPVVSTRTGAIAELVSAQSGLLVEPEDRAALHDALARLLGDPVLLRQLAAGARDAGAKLPSWSAASRRLADVLAGVVRAPVAARLHA